MSQTDEKKTKLELTEAETAALRAYAQRFVVRKRSYSSAESASEGFWEWTKHVKTRDEEKGRVSPFPRWPFLQEAERSQEKHRLNIWLKPRQMMISNLNCAKRLYRAARSNIQRGEAYLGLIVSMGEREALELMRRIQFMYDSLPDWLKEPVIKRTESELIFANGGRLVCLPASARIGHSYTATDIFLDEWARLPYDREMHAGLMPTIGTMGHLDGVSTPNGMFNVFAELWNQPDSDWNKIELNWWDHPMRDDAWAEAEKKKVCPDYPHDLSIWQQQYEKAFNIFTEKKVYPGFSERHVDNELKFSPDDTLYRGWDFGGHVAAVVFFQVVRRKVHVLREIIVTDHQVSKASSVTVNPDNNIEDLATMVMDRTQAFYPGAAIRDFCDPQGAQVSDLSRRSERSRIEVLNTFGIYPEYRFSNISEGVEIIRMRMRERPDGAFGLIVNANNCPVLTDGFRGGICRRPAPHGQVFTSEETIRKDGWYEHVHDAFRYGMVGVFRTSERPVAKGRSRVSLHYHPVTGLPM